MAVKRGLGKSFGKIFGEDKIINDNNDSNQNNLENDNEYHNIKVPDSQLFVRPKAPENDNSSQVLKEESIESVFEQLDRNEEAKTDEKHNNDNDNHNQYDEKEQNA